MLQCKQSCNQKFTENLICCVNFVRCDCDVNHGEEQKRRKEENTYQTAKTGQNWQIEGLCKIHVFEDIGGIN